MTVYTIGFGQKSAREFFELLRQAGVRRVVDVRLRPGGQLAGFTKKEDLRYFLSRLLRSDYVHLPELAPTAAVLDAYREDHDWDAYVVAFEALMDERRIAATLDRALFAEGPCCLLCSEPTPEHCHRRLVAERLAREWGDVEVVHL